MVEWSFGGFLVLWLPEKTTFVHLWKWFFHEPFMKTIRLDYVVGYISLINYSN
jgi:hypothetical protein